MLGGLFNIGFRNRKRANEIYYAFSDDLKNKNKNQCIWNQSHAKLKIQTKDPMRDFCKCLILDKNSYDATFCVLNDNLRQFKLSQIVDNVNTHILNSFHMDLHKVKITLFLFLFLFLFAKLTICLC